MIIRGRKDLTVLAILIVLVGVAALVVLRMRGGSGSSSEPPSPQRPLHYYQFVDAAAGGSVVLDSGQHPTLMGFGPEGRQAWIYSLPSHVMPVISSCTGPCPNVAVSGNLLGTPTTADPAVIWESADGTRAEESSDYDGSAGKKRVLVAASRDVAIIQESDLHGHGRVELRDAPHASLFVPIPTAAVTALLAAQSDPAMSKAVVAVPTGDGASLVVTWYVRTLDGWQERGQAQVPGSQHLACVDWTANTAVLMGSASTQEVGLSGGEPKTLSVAPGSNCGFDATGLFISDLPQGHGYQYDNDGRLRWSVALSGSVVLSVLPDSPLVALGGRNASEVFAGNGTRADDLRAGSWARLVAPGKVLYLTQDGQVHLESVR